jgi:hypothetical protein
MGAPVPPPRAPRRHAGWDEEDFQQRVREEASEEFVYVDAHLLCTPAVADIGDNPIHQRDLGVSRVPPHTRTLLSP